MNPRQVPWTMVVFLLGAVCGGIWWGGGLTERVNAQEAKSVEINLRLVRIEDKIDKLFELLVGRPP